MKNNKKGFTLAELLIVVAVIAVLVAVAIPTFSNQLEKSRQAVDISNLRGAYAAAKVVAMDGVLPGDNVAISSGMQYYYLPDSGEIVDTLPTGHVGYGKSLSTKLRADVSNLPDCIKNCYLEGDGIDEDSWTATADSKADDISAVTGTTEGKTIQITFGVDSKGLLTVVAVYFA